MTPDTTPPPSRPTIVQIAAAFLLIGATAFGGQVALLALLNRELVERRGWVTADAINEAFTYTKLLPGPVVVQVVAYLGYRLRGVPGVIVASTLFLLPSAASMLILGVLYERIRLNAGVTAALAGLMAAVVGVIAVATYGQMRKALADRVHVVVAVAVFIAAIVWNLNPALLVLAAGALGIVRSLVSREPTAPGTAE